MTGATSEKLGQFSSCLVKCLTEMSLGRKNDESGIWSHVTRRSACKVTCEYGSSGALSFFLGAKRVSRSVLARVKFSENPERSTTEEISRRSARVRVKFVGLGHERKIVGTAASP